MSDKWQIKFHPAVFFVWREYMKGCKHEVYVAEILKSIRTKNDALLNIKHENDIVRYHSEKILRGEFSYESHNKSD